MSKNRQTSELINHISVDSSGSIVMTGDIIMPGGSKAATESYVGTAISNLVDSSPATLDTLNELAAALGDDPNFATTVATSIGTKQPQLNGTGFVKATGTTISYDNSTYLTTSSASSTYLPLAGGTLTGALNGTSAIFSSTIRSNDTNGLALGSIAGYRRIQYDLANTRFGFLTDGNSLANLEANTATFSSTIASSGDITITKASAASFIANNTSASGKSYRLVSADDGKFYIQNTGILDLFNITSTGVSTFISDIILSAANPFIYGGTAAGGIGISNIGGQTYIKTYGASHATSANVTQFVNGSSTSLTISSTGAATFSSSVTATQYTATSTGGSGLRVYGGSGTNQWDMYLNSTNLRFSDNTGTGSIVFDRPISGTSATFSGGATFFNGGNTFAFEQNVLNSGNADGAHIRNVVSSAANPTYSWAGDTDTGMYKDSANTISFSTNGVNRLTIASTGAATFSSTIAAGGAIKTSGQNTVNEASVLKFSQESSTVSQIAVYGATTGTAGILNIVLKSSDASVNTVALSLASTGAATFSSSATASGRIHAKTYGNASKGSFLMGTENDSESKWSYLCSTQYNSSSNPSGYSVIGGYTSATENKVIIGGSIYEANPCTSIEFWTHTAVTHATGGTLRMRITTDGIKGAIYFDAQSSSGYRIRNSSDTANAGGFTRRGLWEGNANYDPGLWAETGYGLYFYSNGSADIRAFFNTSGHFLPGANNTYNLGSSSNGWANIYTNDLHLSNMNKPEGNDIDGTSGNWTIQEGAENLYIINNLSNKRFKINLEEII